MIGFLFWLDWHVHCGYDLGFDPCDIAAAGLRGSLPGPSCLPLPLGESRPDVLCVQKGGVGSREGGVFCWGSLFGFCLGASLLSGSILFSQDRWQLEGYYLSSWSLVTDGGVDKEFGTFLRLNPQEVSRGKGSNWGLHDW